MLLPPVLVISAGFILLQSIGNIPVCLVIMALFIGFEPVTRITALSCKQVKHYVSQDNKSILVVVVGLTDKVCSIQSHML